MRKTIVTLVALCAAMAANATVLRVSNVNGSTAPYSSIKAALADAAEGDTIMLDTSGTPYDNTPINKRIVLIGPGYWLQENGIIDEGSSRAFFDNDLSIEASGVVVTGIWCSYVIKIRKECTDVVIKRCNLRDGVVFESKTARCVLLQNYIRNGITGNGSFHQITNNIFIRHFADIYTFKSMPNSYVAYNTFLGKNKIRFWDSGDCTVEKNIGGDEFYDSSGGTSNYSDNIIIETAYNTYDNPITDSGLQALNLSSTHGAFAGDSPYVISGVPSAPVIEDLVVPTTVEYGSKMNVTIKVSVQK